jgi:hypothetical protein
MMFFFNRPTPAPLRLAIGVVVIVLGVTLHMLTLTIAGVAALVIAGVQFYNRRGHRGNDR